MAFTGLEAAALNVKINLPCILDKAITTDAFEKTESCRDEGRRLKTEIIEIVNKRIGDF